METPGQNHNTPAAGQPPEAREARELTQAAHAFAVAAHTLARTNAALLARLAELPPLEDGWAGPHTETLREAMADVQTRGRVAAATPEQISNLLFRIAREMENRAHPKQPRRARNVLPR